MRVSIPARCLTVSAFQTANGLINSTALSIAVPAYRNWAAAGWNGLSAPVEWGGQGLPYALNAALIEVWSGASMAFELGPLADHVGDRVDRRARLAAIAGDLSAAAR